MGLLIISLLLNLATKQVGSPHQSYQNHSDCQNTGKSNITFFYTNADSLLNKINELKVRLSLFQPDILAINEMCPKHYCVTESLQLQGYDLFCSDFSGGRGICLYCKSSLKANKYDFEECLWCSVPVDRNNFILVGVFYHSPSSSTDNDTHLMKLITEATHNCTSHLLIMGDFNFPDINWEDWSSTGGNMEGNIFLSILYDNFLFQHIGFPTR